MSLPGTSSPTGPDGPFSGNAGDEDETLPFTAASPSDLLRANAGRILGAMLGESFAGMEGEGDRIGPYRLCEIIGEGGFGNVWRAEQEEPVRREVALKLVKPGMDTAQVLGRFNQERQALAALEHPNIATMLDAGVGPNGRPYFAMELVRGGTLTRWCRERSTPLKERLRLFIQLCQAVQHAHDKGLLHRDLKPSNVLVAEVDDRPVPKIIDFGIAKVMDGVSTEHSLLTQAGQVLGTPLYMSPEQIHGGSELDARSDVYALGVLLYELLTGATPFARDVAVKGGVEGIKRAILETDPDRPSTRLRRERQLTASSRAKTGVADKIASLPTDLDWITMRALEKCRERRYASAADLAADVQRHLDSQPVLACGPDLVYKARRWTNRHRRMLATASAGIAVGILALSVPRFLESEFWRDTRAAVRHAWLFEIGFKPAPSASEATHSTPFVNSLGMRFVPVPITGGPTDGQRVLFSIWTTRAQDYEVFVAESKLDWTRPTFEQGPTHPAVMMDWDEAGAFCAWLTLRERADGKLRADQAYRLPSDHEWSCAVGIGDREDPDLLPVQKRELNRGLYPWGTQWPPPDHVGNYLSRESKERALTNWPVLSSGMLHGPIPDYRDGHALTAPVGSFAPNSLGLYDMGGNVWQWCEDLFGEETKRVIRGCSWFDFSQHQMESSRRSSLSPRLRHEHLGFRVVLAPAGGHAAETSVQPAAAEQTATQPLTNSLGMKFVPVPGTKVLFCIHETRRQDYAAFADATPGLATSWTNTTMGNVPVGHSPDHPVVAITWNTANAFCEWLSKKEGRRYRLPTDREWSIAVGLGKEDEPAADLSPEELGQRVIDHYPWGGSFPPRSDDRAGNYADTAWHESFPDRPWIAGYTDGYATTAPVMSFKPNALGLYDMGGNVEEWCLDLYSPSHPDRRVTRGFSYHVSSLRMMRSNRRGYGIEPIPSNGTGFRIVLETSADPPGAPQP